jgi:hypothetical protein
MDKEVERSRKVRVVRAESQTLSSVCLSVCLLESSCFPKKLINLCAPPPFPTANSCKLSSHVIMSPGTVLSVKGRTWHLQGLPICSSQPLGLGVWNRHYFKLTPSQYPLTHFTDHKTEQDSSALGTSPPTSQNILQQEGCPHPPESQFKISA